MTNLSRRENNYEVSIDHCSLIVIVEVVENKQ